MLSVACPKPLLVSEKTNDPNCGVAFVKFEDRRDLERAEQEVVKGHISFDGNPVRLQKSLPRYWPTEQTRRYY